MQALEAVLGNPGVVRGYVMDMERQGKNPWAQDSFCFPQ